MERNLSPAAIITYNVWSAMSNVKKEVSRLAHLSLLSFICQDAPPQALGSPYPCSQAFQLNNLAMIDEAVDFRPVILDIPREHFRVGGLEHQLLYAQGANDFGRGIGSPCFDVFGNPLGLEHNHIGTGL